MSGAVLIITITDRCRGEEFAAWYQSQGIPLILTTLGRGTATTEILDCLGIESNEKTVLLCMAPRSSGFVHRAAKELWLDIPGTGLLMTVPVSSIGGTAARDYLLPQQKQEEAEKHMENNLTHELLVVITNQGFTDMVMDAARGAGATGGTAVHAKGTGTELAKKFFGVSIAAEKELVFILTKPEDRRAIMKAIVTHAGMQTPAKSIVFSMPVCDVAGLRVFDSEE